MWKALVLKELHQVRLFAILALAAYLYLVFGLMGLPHLPGLTPGPGEIPFQGPSFVVAFRVVSLLLAVCLGIHLTLVESIGGTYGFLLTRPAGRSAIYVKLLLGAGVYLAVSAIPILVYALWASVPGTHASPFYWSATAPAWLAWIGIGAVYLGAFMAGIRRGRWLGTRLLPLTTGSVCALLIGTDHTSLALRMVGAVLALIMVFATTHVIQTRDFS